MDLTLVPRKLNIWRVILTWAARIFVTATTKPATKSIPAAGKPDTPSRIVRSTCAPPSAGPAEQYVGPGNKPSTARDHMGTTNQAPATSTIPPERMVYPGVEAGSVQRTGRHSGLAHVFPTREPDQVITPQGGHHQAQRRQPPTQAHQSQRPPHPQPE